LPIIAGEAIKLSSRKFLATISNMVLDFGPDSPDDIAGCLISFVLSAGIAVIKKFDYPRQQEPNVLSRELRLSI
jgi:hypothetical protein